MTEWIHDGAQHIEGEELPDGSVPSFLVEKWLPWVTEALDLMDADGAFRNFPLPGSLREQPAYDMEVLRTIRQRWVELQNEQLKGIRRGKV